MAALHGWDLSPREAAAVQEELRHQIRLERLDPATVTTVAGCDLSCRRGSQCIWAGIVVIELATMATIEEVCLRSEARFPYVPGLLGFRELPPLLEAFDRLTARPDVLLLDGHGLAHPRRFGLACHAGLWLDLPAAGCAKSRLVGSHDELGRAAGSTADLTDGGEVIGRLLRTRDGVAPVYVSIGHRVTLEDAVALAWRCLAGRRLPEPTRRAHELVNRVRREDTTCDGP